MDPVCCLLGVCCPPEARRARLIEWIVSWDVDRKTAEIVADRLIEAADRSSFGRFFKMIGDQVRQHPHN